jgi:heptosyltransferase-3
MHDRPASKSGGRILIIRGGAIGDFILTLPVLAALQSRFPGRHIEVMGYPHIAQLALAGGLAAKVRPIEARSMATFFAKGCDLDAQMSQYFSSFTLIVSYLYDPDGVFQENIERCTFAEFITAPHRPDEKQKIHATDVFLKPLEQLAIANPDNVPRLALKEPPPETLPEGRWVAFHPGSGSERKNWPERKWGELLQEVTRQSDAGLLMVGGEAEGDRLQRLSAGLPPNRFKLARNLPLPALAGMLKQCSIFVGHDSGITHLAAALGLPGIVLWGDSSEVIWAPRNPRMAVVREERGLVALPVAQVMGRLTAILANT